ncbi:MAG: cbb3-type cytochrome c oxidase subunit 3 [Sphingomonadaceae bacterium]
MDVSHHLVVAFAKSFGLFYLLVMALAVLAYAFWPANRDRFDQAARDVVEDEDEPWA